MRTTIPCIKIEGKDNYDFGYKLGKKLSSKIKKRLELNKEMYAKRAQTKHTFKELIKKAKKFLPAIEKNFPHLLKEAKGMANGAGIDFDEFLVCLCDEEIVDFEFILHCTSVGLKTEDGKILLGHNEDWFPEYKKNGLVLVRGKIGKKKFLGLSYIGNLTGSAGGMNEKVAYTDTSFWFSKFEYKVPRSFHLRALLDAEKPEHAIKILNTQGSIVSNTLLTFGDEILDVEELYTKEAIYRPEKWIVHTNHPIKKEHRIKAFHEKETESVARYERAREIMSKEKKPSINSIHKVLTDHKTNICGHISNKNDDTTITIASYVFNPKEKWVRIYHGNPCNHKFKKYSL